MAGEIKSSQIGSGTISTSKISNDAFDYEHFNANGNYYPYITTHAINLGAPGIQQLFNANFPRKARIEAALYITIAPINEGIWIDEGTGVFLSQFTNVNGLCPIILGTGSTVDTNGNVIFHTDNITFGFLIIFWIFKS